MQDFSPFYSEWHTDRSAFFSSSHGAATQSLPASETGWDCFYLHSWFLPRGAEASTLHLCHTPHLQDDADTHFQLSWGAMGARFTILEKQMPNPSFCMYWAACRLRHWLLLPHIIWFLFSSFALQLLSLSLLLVLLQAEIIAGSNDSRSWGS